VDGGPRPTFSVLFVCDANVGVSPMAERLARAISRERFGAEAVSVAFASAGTDAYPNDPMNRHAARVLREYRADDAAFRSREVDEALVRAADLVLTANRDERAYCAGVAPEAVGRTFTLRQFRRWVEAVNPHYLPSATLGERLREVLAETVTVRAGFQPVPARADDLPDPVSHSLDAYRASAREIWTILDAVMTAVARPTAMAARQP
jgi:protein-tyrosine phosphatase